MKETLVYTEYHPRWHREPVSTYWWTRQWKHLKFILRELSSLSVAYFVVLTLLQLRALSGGPANYRAFEDWLKTPLMIALNVIIFFFVLFHAITWFNLTPKAMPLRVRGKRVPDWLISGPNYFAWLVISAIIAWLILRG